MISVIILTKNLKYAVLDVPENGKLQIKEEHVICGMVQNGVKVIPYGTTLTAFESYVFYECLSAELVPFSEFQEYGRVLDFNIIELLQVSNTIPMANSGSSVPYTKPVYYANGAPIEYNLKILGTNLKTAEEAELYFKNGNEASHPMKINAVTNSGDYQLFSVYNTTTMPLPLYVNNTITEIEDLTGFITSIASNYFENNAKIKRVILPAVTAIGTSFYHASNLQYCKMDSLKSVGYQGFIGCGKLTEFIAPNMETLADMALAQCYTIGDLYFPKLTALGSDALNNNMFQYGNATTYQACTLSVPRSFETNNAGSPDGDITDLLSKGGTVLYLD